MTEQTRRNVLRYGIAIDLVILATGVGMIVPPTAPLLILMFTAAVILSTWKGGWKGGYLALILSLVALVGIFPDVASLPQLLLITVLSLAGSAVTVYATRPPLLPATPMIAPVSQPVAVTPDPAVADEPEPEPAFVDRPAAAFAEQPLATLAEQPEVSFAEQPLQRNGLAAVVPMPLEPRGPEPEPNVEPARAKRGKKRSKGEIARAAAEETARRREEEERVAAEAEARRREEEERAAAEAEARRREEEERAAAEAEARRREEEERVAAEAEAQRRAAEARAAAEAEARRREEEARLAAEAEAQRRIEAARLAAEEEARRLEEAERLRVQQELEARLAREREEAQRLLEERLEAERVAAEEEVRQRAEGLRLAAEQEARQKAEEERARVARELQEQLAREREEVQRTLVAALEEDRRRVDEERARLEAERRATEETRLQAEAERVRLEQKLEEELQQELAAELASKREATQRELRERLEAERAAAEEDVRRQLEHEREQLRARADQELAAERARIEKESAEQVAAAQAAAAEAAAAATAAAEAAVAAAAASVTATATSVPAVAAAAPPPPPAAKPAAPPSRSAQPAAPKVSLLDTVTGWFKREPRPNLKVNRSAAGGTGTRRPAATTSASPARRASAAAAPRPRLLLIERRRATADTIVPKLKHRGVDVEVVERWVDAVDELFRFRPNVLCLDVDHPEFEKIYKTVSDKAPQMPIALTGRSGAALSTSVRYAAFVARPYDVDDLARLAQRAQKNIDDLLAEQAMPRTAPKPAQTSAPAPVARTTPAPRPAAPAHAAVQPIPLSPVEVVTPRRASSDGTAYEVVCFSCRVAFDAMDADWCSCLAKERTLVCTNCLACFCKAPPAFKEKFWVEAPPRLFERKTSEVRRQEGSLPPNVSLSAVTRPLVLCVEDDEEIQAIVQRVCSNLGYGFIWATNGQDGLDLAREYRPNLILSDAFMPKLDGREMCRMLKEEPIGADIRMVIMTGLYTDTKYRSEAVKRFHVDDYIAKPVAITELINLLQRHLEGVTGLPMQEDLHELHRRDIELDVDDDREIPLNADEDVPLADILTAPSNGSGSMSSTTGETPALMVRRTGSDSYDVCCFNCQQNFDATRADWCSCVGRDNTLLCEHCGGCFCKAPAAYRERFWIDAPPSLFERKMIGSKRNLSARSNPLPVEVKRPLILLVEDDENVQLIVRTVVSSMGYGFVVGANGQEGLSLAREYDPDLILSDAFMPKLDGREMCRLLKEDPNTARSKAIIMTGLYTDRKYRNEALDYFKVDDYVAKPVAVDDLIKLFKKHLPQEVTTAH